MIPVEAIQIGSTGWLDEDQPLRGEPEQGSQSGRMTGFARQLGDPTPGERRLRPGEHGDSPGVDGRKHRGEGAGQIHPLSMDQ